MTANVETMAYRNEVPWHGLGNSVAGFMKVSDMVTAAGIDWRVNKEPMLLADHTAVPGFFALRRSDNGKVLDVVGSRYHVTQNKDAMEFFTEFVEAGDAEMETMGSLREGRYVWGLANLGATFKMRGNDVVKNYLLLGLPHEHGKGIIGKYVSTRVVCSNTLAIALKETGSLEFRMTHRRLFDGPMIQRAKETLGIAREHAKKFEANARTLQKKSATPQDALEFFADLCGLDKAKLIMPDCDWRDTKECNRTLKTLMDVNERAPGAQPTNAWGLLNAVTYYADHLASRTPDKRLTNAWFGKTARMKETALEMLLSA